MAWKPSNEPTPYYYEERVARLRRVEQAIEALKLPLLRARKILAILSALEMQIGDGGDHPEVNGLLVQALLAAVRHQVGERRGLGVLRAVETFVEAETERWEQLRAGTLAPPELDPEDKLINLVMEGYDHVKARKRVDAVQKWLAAWELVKELATPEMRTTEAFDAAHRDAIEPLFNWSSDLEMELGNAGIDDPVYHEHRVRFVDEFLAQFPDEEDWRYVQMLRAKGEALFRLGRPEEGAKVYGALIDRCPDEAWAYIGWSDQYHFGWGVPVDFERAEALLVRALEHPPLKHRADALERLADLYYRWGRMEDYERTVEKLPAQRRPHRTPWVLEASGPPAEKPGRNDPCWCGSGKKYKHCHWRSDQRG